MDLENITNCPVCNGVDLKDFISAKDHTASQEIFSIKTCSVCELGITTPRPSSANISKYYQSEKYISHTGGNKNITDALYRVARNRMFLWKKNIIEENHSKGNILDYGCGTGEFLAFMKQAQWDISGVEPSELARTKATQNTKTEIYKNLEVATVTDLDVITLWHVAEHLNELDKTIATLKSKLKTGGRMLIAVPNYQSPDGQKYKSYWAGYDVPRHLWHFSKSSITKLVQKNGMKLEDVKPMKLDALYISYLSETYEYPQQSNLLSLAKGVINGVRSNWKAQSETNHSSILYIAKV